MEKAIVSARAMGEYVQAIYQRYRRAARPEKKRILDEFCQVTTYHRKHAIRLLYGPAPGAAGPPRRRPVEQPDGVLAVIGRHLAELVENPLLLRAGRPPVPLIDGLHVLAHGSRTHDGFLHRLRKVTSQMARRFSLGNILDGAIRGVDRLAAQSY